MFDQIKEKINKKIINSKKLTSNFKFIDQNSKKSIKYNDDLYIPFFYYLGKVIKPKTFLEIGLNIAINSSCFLKSCKTVNYFLGFQQKNDQYYNFNIPKSNLSLNYKQNLDIYYGDFFDNDFQKMLSKKFDLIFFNQEYSYDKMFQILETIYSNNLDKDGMLVFCDITKKNYKDIFLNMSKGYRNKFENIDEKIGVIIK